MTIVGWLVLGMVVGWLASALLGAGAYGLTGDIVVGIIGSVVVGSLATQLLHVEVTGLDSTSVVLAVTGTFILMAMFRAVAPSPWSRVKFWRPRQ